MKSRVAVIVVAVVVPLAVLGVVVSQRGSNHEPAKLPIASGTGGQDAVARPALYPYGGVVYRAGSDLPALDGSAHAYKVTADPDRLQKLRAALPQDAFQVDPGSLSWSYVTAAATGVTSGGVAVACAPDAADCPAPVTTVPERPADLPTHDEAKGIALDILQRAGVDTSSVAVTVDDYTTQWSVRIDPIVDGIVTQGFGNYFTIGDHGAVEYANGVLGSIERADEYPLLGTAAAIDLLNQGRGFIGPVPLAAAAEGTLGSASDDVASASTGSGSAGSSAPGAPPLPACDGSGAPTTFACIPPDTPTTGTIPVPPPQEIVLTGAEQVLLFAPSFDGQSAFLVPGYRFRTADGDGPSVLALDQSYIAPPPASDGKIEPAPAPASSGSTDGAQPGFDPAGASLSGG